MLDIVLIVFHYSVVMLALWVAASQIRGRLSTTPDVALAYAIIGLALVGLLMFWISFLSLWAGWLFKAAVLVGLLAGLVLSLRDRDPDDIALAIPIATMAFGLVFLVLAVLGSDPALANHPLTTRIANAWGFTRPGDNVIPFEFAEAIQAARIPSPLHGDWLSSDRPPLQSGMFLVFEIVPMRSNSVYQGLATAFQCLCLPACWALIRSRGGSFTAALAGTILLALSPFFIQNSVYVWPKFLAAALLCSSAQIYLRRDRFGGHILLPHAMGGAAVALAMLAHGASAFAILGFGLAVLITRRAGGLRSVAVAAVTAGALYAPWIAYQQFFDPPGNRLAKWHLAGVIDIDDRSTEGTLLDEYGRLTLESWTDARVKNADRIFKLPPSVFGTAEFTKQNMRGDAFFNFPMALGALTLAMLTVPLFFLLKGSGPLIGVFVFERVAWILLLFEGGSTLPHHGSYLAWPLLSAIGVLAIDRFDGIKLPIFVIMCLMQAILGVYLYA
ncbi:MAG: hypothetical protein AAFX86_15550 [Pseudomonadota bacterium]